MTRSNVVALRKPSVNARLAHVTSYRGLDKDPVLIQVINLVEESPMTLAAIANKSGVAESTIRNWIGGHTRRPQNITMEFVLRAIGYERKIVKLRP